MMLMIELESGGKKELAMLASSSAGCPLARAAPQARGRQLGSLARLARLARDKANWKGHRPKGEMLLVIGSAL